VNRLSEPTQTRWGAVLTVYLAGVVTAAGLGQVAAVLPLMHDELHVSLAAMGWAVSCMTVVGAVVGLPAGAWVQRLGPRRAVLIGLPTLAAASVAGALVGTYPLLLTTRLFAGVGYLLVVVACPALLVRLTGERDRMSALALWSTFVPIGIALSSFAGGVIGPRAGWPAWFLVCATATLAVLAAFAVVVPAARVPGSRRGESGDRVAVGQWMIAPVLLAAGFCAVSSISVAIGVLLPEFFTEERHLALWLAGLITALVSLISVPGSLLTGVLLRRGVPFARLAYLAAAVPVAAVVAFGMTSWVANAAGVAVLSLINGLLIAAVFAAVPALAENEKRLDLVNGLVTQLGSIGALFGPPLLTRAASFGWELLALPIGVIAVPGGLLIWMAVRRKSDQVPASRDPAPAGPG
jgi:MFS family permease